MKIKQLGEKISRAVRQWIDTTREVFSIRTRQTALAKAVEMTWGWAWGYAVTPLVGGFFGRRGGGRMRQPLRRGGLSPQLLELLEPRVLLSSTPVAFVNDNWHATTPGGLINGATVQNTNAGDDGSLSQLTLGTNAFSSLTQALQTVPANSKIVIVSGTYSGAEQADIKTDGLTIEGWSQFAAETTASGTYAGPGTLNIAAMRAYVASLDTGTYTIDASNVTVEGISVVEQDSSAGIRVGATGTGFTISGNNFTDDTTGISVGHGTGSITGNTFDAGLTSYIVNLSGNEISALNNNFGGIDTSSATNSQFFDIDDKITDGLDATGSGLVRLKTATVFVTQNSDSIQRGVNLAAANDTVNIQAGTYKENVTVNNAMTLLGAEAGVTGANAAGATPTRTSTSETQLVTDGNQAAVITIAASGVTIDGLKIEGNDPAATGSSLTSGNDANATYGILVSGARSNLTIQNDIVENVAVGFYGTGAASGNVITRNWFNSIGVYDYGYAVTLRANFYANVTDNLMTGVQSGIDTNNFFGAGGPATFTFSGNTISAYGAGIWDNLQYNNATSLTIDDNTITSLQAPVTDANAAVRSNFDNNSIGILLVSIQDSVGVTLTNNDISGMAFGVTLFNVATSNTITLGNTNDIHNNTVGVYLTNIIDNNPVSRTELGGDPAHVPSGYSGPNNPNAISNVIVDDLHLQNNTTGIEVRGDNGFTPYGVSLTIKDGTAISGGSTGLLVTGSGAAVAGDTLADTTFTGQSANYVSLTAGAMAGQTLDASGATFDGSLASAAALPGAYAIEDKITDYLDTPTAGYVELNASNVYVTQDSENATAGAIQRGVNEAPVGGTVNVQAGTFAGEIAIRQSVHLLGANAAANPTDGGVRAGESTIEPAVSGANPYSGAHTFLVEVLASNVTVEGFTLTGQNTALSDANGAALTETGTTPIISQAAEGIVGYDPTGITDLSANSSAPGAAMPSGIHIENNIIENLTYQGVDLGWGTSGAASSRNTIADNVIQNIGAYNDEGSAIRLYNNFYADVTGNQILNTRMGVEVGNFYNANPGATGSISGNQIQVRRRGVLYNLFYASASALPVSNNVITATVDDPSIVADASLWTGIYVMSQNGTNTASFSDNAIDGARSNYATTAGYTILNAWSTDAVQIAGDASANNNIKNVTYGVWETSGDPNGFGAGAAQDMSVTLNGLDIAASQIGVYVESDPSVPTPHVLATIDGGTTISGGVTGIEVSGAHAAANISNATIDDPATGILVSGGSATISDASIYNNTTGVDFTAGGSGSVSGVDFDNDAAGPANGTDLQIDASAGTVTDGGANLFAGAAMYISDQAAADTLDATTDFFDGVVLNPLNVSQAYGIENKISDYLDTPADGYVELNAGKTYVTQHSENTTADAIQRGVNKASAGGTVNVQAGNFVGNVVIGTSLTLDGAGGANLTAPAVGSNAAIVSVAAKNVTVEGLNITVNQPYAGAGIAAVSSASGPNLFDGLHILNNVITTTGTGGGLYNPLDATTYSAGIAVLANGNGAFPTVTISGNTVSANIAGSSYLKRGLWMFQVQGTIGGATAADGNSLQGTYEDLQDSFASGGATTLENNTFAGAGLTITEPNANAPISISRNTFDSTLGGVDDAALVVKHDYQASSPVTISDNAFTLSANSIGVLSAASTGVSVTGNAFTPAADGSGEVTGTVAIDVDTMVPSGSQPAPLVADSISVTGNTFNADAGSDATAVQIANNNANASFGAITIGGSGTDANTFNQNLANFIVEAAPTGSVSFSGDAYSGTKVDAGDVALNIDASGNNFGVSSGDAPGAYTLTDYYAIEDKIVDGLDYAGAGLVTINPGNIYVTQVSENTNADAIQRGVNLATAGDTVHVQAGDFVGQVAISESLTLLGAGEGQTIVQAPGSLAATGSDTFVYSGSTKQSVITISGVDAAAGVTLKDLTVDGNNRGDAVASGNDFVGIGIHNSNATIDTVAVMGVEDAVFDGAQRGRAIFVGNDARTHDVTVENSTISGYQKNGVDVRGAGLAATITGNTITGAGAGNINGQNGIVVGFGAVGTVTGNTISGNLYGGTDPNGYAAGVLLYDAGNGTKVQNNTSIDRNDVGVELESNTGNATYTITGNTVTNSAIAGVYLMTNVHGTGVTGNTLTGNAAAVGIDSGASNLGAITGNTFTGGTLYIDNQSANAIDATTDTFDVGASSAQVAGSALSVAQGYAVENKITDALDQTGLGFVRLQNGAVFVAQSSETASAGAIQRGVNAANTNETSVPPDGDIVNVETGAYAGNVNISNALTLAGSGSTTAGSVLSVSTGNAVTISADNITVSGLRIVGNSSTNGLYFNSTTANTALSNIVATGNSYDIEVHNNAVLTNLSLDQVSLINASDGLRVATTGVVQGLTITNSHFDNDLDGFGIFANSGSTANQSGFNNIQISDSTFSNDQLKGLYAEKFNNATLDNITMTDSGTGTSSPNGLNLNLKYGAYTNITVENSTFTSDGTGAANAAAVDIEGRNDAPSYNSKPGTLAGLTLTNNTFDGTSPVDLVIANNVTGVSLSTQKLGGSGIGLVAGDTATGLNLADTAFDSSLALYIVNTTNFSLDATQGATFDSFNAGAGSAATDLATYYAVEDKIVDGIDLSGPGLVRLKAGNVFVTPNSYPATGGTTSASIQRAIGMASAGDTVNIEGGSYTGGIDSSTKGLTFALGNAPETVTVGGDVVFHGDDTLDLKIDGVANGTYDHLVLTSGNLDLGGAHLDTLASTVVTTAGNSVQFITDNGGTVTGNFAGIGNAAVFNLNSQPFEMFYNAGDVTSARLSDSVPTPPPGGTSSTPPQPTVVYVNSGFTGSDGSDADGSGPGTALGYDEFTDIQSAINAVASHGTVMIANGTYDPSNILVNIPVTIDGASEAGVIITPSLIDSHDDSSFGGATISNGFIIASSGVTIENLTLDGGSDQDFRNGIITNSPNDGHTYSDININHVAVDNVYRKGIAIYNETGIASGISIENNSFDNVGSQINDGGNAYEATAAIAVFGSDAQIENNTIAHSSAGIEANTFDGSAMTLTITGNQFSLPSTVLAKGALGIDAASVAGGSDISGNTIDLTGGSNNDVGLVVSFDSGAVTVDNNNITTTGGDDGIVLYQDASNVTVSGNQVTGASTGTGILVTAQSTDTQRFDDAPGAVSATLTGNTVNGPAVGIAVASDAAAEDTAVVSISGTNAISGATTGIEIDGAHASATISGANVYNNTTGIDFIQGATGSLAGVDFDHAAAGPANGTDLHVEASAGAVTDGGGNLFGGTQYINNQAGGNLDATTDSFNGVAAASLTPALAFGVENKVTDYLDKPADGYVKLQANDVYVTQQSETTTAGAVQRGINVTPGSGTLHLDAGTYVGALTIDHAMTLVGPNAGINPNSNTRAAEAIILPGTSAPTPFVATPLSDITITHRNVAIEGVTIDGDNPALTSGVVQNGADIDASEAITTLDTDGSPANVTVSDNIIQNFAYAGVDLGGDFSGAATSSGSVVSDNKIDNLGGGDYGYGIGVILYNNQYAQVTGNAISRSRVGVQVGNFSVADSGAAGSISGNSISASSRGIFYNLMYGNSSAFTVANNTITALSDSSVSRFDGIMLSSIQGTTSITVSDNSITIGAIAQAISDGYQVWNTSTTGAVTISGGTVIGGAYGVWVNSYEGYPSTGSAADVTHATVSGVAISGTSAAGVYIEDSAANTAHPAVSATINGNTTLSGGTVGIKVSGANASANISATTIDDPTTGILVSGGSATIANDSVYNNTTGIDFTAGGSGSVQSVDFDNAGSGPANTTDLQMDATAGIVNILDGNTFAASTDYIVNLSSENFDLSALTNTTFGGFNAAAGAVPADLTSYYATEDKIVDAIDRTGSGLVRLKAGNIFVTPSSFTAPASNDTGALQRAIDAAALGDTVHVDAGTYFDNVTIGKRITLAGAGDGSDASSNTVIKSVAADSPVVTITGSGDDSAHQLTVTGVYVTGASASSGDAGAGVLITPGAGTIAHVTLDDIASVGNSGAGVAVNGTGSASDITISNAAISGNSAEGIRAGGVNSTLASLNGLTIEGTAVNHTTIGNNVGDGIVVYGPGTDTNINIGYVDLTDDGSTAGYNPNPAEINMFHVTGNVTVHDVNINTNSYAYGVQFDGNGYSVPAGTLSLTNVLVAGSVRKGAMAFQNYQNLDGVTLSGVDITATAGWGSLIVDDTGAPLNLGDTTISVPAAAQALGQQAIVLWNAGGVDATGATINGINLAASPTLSDLYTVEDAVVDSVDVSGLGLVRLKQKNIFVTPHSFYTAYGTTAASIQRGVDSASDGDTVNVEAGTYTRAGAGDSVVNINKSVSVVGTAGAASTIIDGDSAGENYYVVKITASNVALSGFTITNPLYSSSADASGILVEALTANTPLTGISVHDNIIHDIGELNRPVAATGEMGINIEGEEPGSGVTNSSFDDNIIYNISSADPNGFAIGIITAGDVGKEVDGISIDGNTIYNISNPGLAAGIDAGYGSQNITISDNTIGINPTGPTPTPGPIANGIRTGSGVFGNVDITANTIANASVAAVDLNSPFSETVSENTISDSGVGIKVESDATLTSATHNYFNHNATGVLIDAGAAAVGPININSFTGNTTAGLDNESAITINDANNWWNSADGPNSDLNTFHPGNTAGDKVIGVAVIAPWLTDGIDSDTSTPGFQHDPANSAAPVAPGAPSLDASSDSFEPANGSDAGLGSNSDNLTNKSTPTFNGTSDATDAGDTIDILEGSTVLGTSTVKTDGSWSVTLSDPLADGGHTVFARITNALGVDASGDSLTITIDTTKPAAGTIDLTDASDSRDPNAAPLIGSDTDNITNSTTPTFTGAAETGALVRLYANGNEVRSAIAADNAYSITLPANTLADGSYMMTVVVIDAAGNHADPSATLNITIDTARPNAPAALDLASSSDTFDPNANPLIGTDSDNITHDNNPTFTGTAEAGTLIRLYVDNVEVGHTVASGAAGNPGGAGTWSIDTMLADGTHTITATATDTAGNVSLSSDALTVTIDTAAPAAPSTPDLTTGSDSLNYDGISSIGTNSDNITNVNTPTFTGTAEAGTLIRLYANGIEVGSTTASGAPGNPGAADATWSITASTLVDGNYAITATATDTAGNTLGTSGTLNVTIDTAAPAAPSTPDLTTGSDSLNNDGISSIGTNSDNITSDNTPTFTGTAEAGTLIRLYANGIEVGSTTASGAPGNPGAADAAWSITASALTDGNYAVTATATDTAGNTLGSSGTLNITIDTAAPAAPSTPDLTTGSDSLNNDGISSIGTNSDNITSDNTPTFTGTAEAGTLIRLYANGIEVGSATASGTPGNPGAADAAWSITASTLVDGNYAITATATDTAGNTLGTSGTLNITVDTAAPNAPSTPDLTNASDSSDPNANPVIGTNSDNITNVNTPTFTGTAEAGTLIRLYANGIEVGSTTASGTPGNPGAADATWSITASALADGTYAITATATDTAGNTLGTSGTLNITIDTAAPTTSAPDLASASDSGTSSTDNITNVTTPTLNGTGEVGALIRLSADGTQIGTTFVDGSGNWSITASALSEGAHTLHATATDTAGNVSDASSDLSIFIDTTAPNLASNVLSYTDNEGTPLTLTGSFTDAGAGTPAQLWHFVSATTGQVVADSAANTLNFTPADNGTYHFTYTVTDAAGNTTSDAVTVTVNNVAPVIAISGSSATDPTGATVKEEGVYSLTLGQITDPGADTVSAYTINWGDGTFQTFSTSNGDPMPTAANPITKTHTYGDGPNGYTIRVNLTDEDGTFFNAATKAVSVQDVPPAATLSNSGGDTDEGQAGQVSFTAQTDVSPTDTAAGFHYAFDFDNDGMFDSGDGSYNGSGTAATVSVPGTYLTVPGVHTIVGRIIDKDGGYTDYTTTINVVNDAPIVNIPATASASQGIPFTFNGSFTDAGDDSNWTGTVDYGDGSGSHTLAVDSTNKTFALSHTYATAGNYQLVVTITDSPHSYDGQPAAAPLTGTAATALTVNAVTLRLTSAVATTDGFDLTFNKPITAADLQMYGSGAVVSPLTVKLGSTSLSGSLVFDSSLTTAHWVQTSGALAAGTYTLTLASGTSGNNFHATGAEALDGNNDGTAGDNAVRTIMVAASSARVISIPNFARGAGQSVLVNSGGTQAGAAGLPINISDGTGVQSVEFILHYDPSLLTIDPTAFTLPGANWAATINATTPGELHVVVFSTNSGTLAAGSQAVITFTHVSVPSTAPYGAAELLSFTNVLLNENLTNPIASSGESAIHKAVDLGDVDDVGGVNSQDAHLISRVVADLDTGFAADPLTDPTIVGDLTGDRTLSGLDATDASLMATNPASQSQVPTPLAHSVTASVDPTVQAGKGAASTVLAAAGQNISTTIQITDDADTLTSADLVITYDPSLLTMATDANGDALGITLDTSDNPALAGWGITTHIVAPGTINVGFFSTGDALTAGPASLLNVTFTVPSTDANNAVSALNVAPNNLSGLNGGALQMTSDSGTITIDAAAPTITKVYAAGSTWAPAFLNYLASTSQGSSTYGYAMPTGAGQLTDLPWTNINRISVQFSEDVNVSELSLAMTGINMPSYTPNGFVYNSVTHVATWSLAQAIKVDKVLLTIDSSSVSDDAGNHLDGEWTNSVSTTSGNGTAGGDFSYRMNVVPGDVDGNGGVNTLDTAAVRNHQATSASAPANYFIQYDVDGNGGVNTLDTAAVRNLQATSLPSGEPQPPISNGPEVPAISEVAVPADVGAITVSATTSATITLVVTGTATAVLTAPVTTSAPAVIASPVAIAPVVAAVPAVTEAPAVVAIPTVVAPVAHVITGPVANVPATIVTVAAPPHVGTVQPASIVNLPTVASSLAVPISNKMPLIAAAVPVTIQALAAGSATVNVVIKPMANLVIAMPKVNALLVKAPAQITQGSAWHTTAEASDQIKLLDERD